MYEPIDFTTYKTNKPSSSSYIDNNQNEQLTKTLSFEHANINLQLSKDILEKLQKAEVKEGDPMEKDLILKYIDSLDKKYDDFKNDMVESEKRIREERRESETRLDKKMEDLFARMDKTAESIDIRVRHMEDKVDGTTKWINGLILTAILSIAAIVVTVIIK